MAATLYTPENYRAPKYDPFFNKYREETLYVEPSPDITKVAPSADFSIQTDRKGFADRNAGTIGTIFTFSATITTDNNTPLSRLEARWDFEGDGVWDTYFSRVKTAKHVYDTAGTYDVTLEILDSEGAVAHKTKRIIVVHNTEPTAQLRFKPITGTENTIFEFDTGKSFDSQYNRNQLEYRFDWGSDGVWDTHFQRKTNWRHKFEIAGFQTITMEVRDPENLTDQLTVTILTEANIPPYADFTVGVKQDPHHPEDPTIYVFDASMTTDVETPSKRLLYRWDFNYTGADDIVFDTNFSTASKHSGTFTTRGLKTIRLQVKDADGAMSELIQEIEI